MKPLPLSLLACLLAHMPAIADDTFTSPRVIVNAEIAAVPNGDQEVFTGACLYCDVIESSYLAESQREQTRVANREQEVTLLQSRLVRFGVHQLRFTAVGGDELTTEDVIARFKANPLALMLPHGAKLHPQLASSLMPDTVIVSRVDRRPTPLRLVPRPDGG
ncbi:hypothetical protein K227x_16900 [Rubripirellula lacrimiformis]|uniref:Uncharacterized protein n=1 Tax=Rubripirellula lacrimiformis TaxID=1930273 RepID=A0A517N8I2_9BACT|nr:hypothetical protein K227x_16900 [Rubripirellula lacrimiformis]